MRKFVSLAFILAVLPFTQAALAGSLAGNGAVAPLAASAAHADSFSDWGTPISSGVIVSFADSSSAFRPSADQVANLADAKGAALVTIRGRTSTDKPTASDEALALARALSARTYLIAHGVSPLKIVINFASATDFIADNSTPEGRHTNQRVEVEMIFVTPVSN